MTEEVENISESAESLEDFWYQVDASNGFEVSIWGRNVAEEFGVPSLLQPVWPDGTRWASESEAANWAEATINYMKDPENVKFKAGNGPSAPLVENSQEVVE